MSSGCRETGDSKMSLLWSMRFVADAMPSTLCSYNAMTMKPLAYTRGQQLPAILEQRIAILDGAMGTMTQRFKLTEADYRGERFRDHPKDVRNNGDLLSLTRPDVI